MGQVHDKQANQGNEVGQDGQVIVAALHSNAVNEKATHSRHKRLHRMRSVLRHQVASSKARTGARILAQLIPRGSHPEEQSRASNTKASKALRTDVFVAHNQARARHDAFVCDGVFQSSWHIRIAWHIHSETPPGENQNLFARLTVRTYVWIVPDWTLQQSVAKSTERQVQQVAYQGKL